MVMRALAGLALAYAFAITVLYLTGRYPRHRVESAWLIFAGLALARVLSLLWRAPRGADRDPEPGDRFALPCFLVASLLLYLPSISVGRFSDDFVLLEIASGWRIVPSEWEHFRPLPMALWAALASAHLAVPWLLHVLNVVLHGANGFLAYRLGREIGGTPLVAAAAGAIFISFPGAVETVTWIAGFPDLLMTACVLGFLLAALRRAHLAALILLVLGTLAKETAVAAPVLLILLHVIRPVSLRFAGAAAAWCIAFAIARLYLSPSEGFLHLPDRYFAKEFLVRVYGTLALPWTQEQLHRMPAAAIASLTALAALLAAGAVMRDPAGGRSRHVLSFGAWPLLAAAPVYAYLYVAPDLQGSRHLYLPAVGWGLLLAWLALGWRVAAGRIMLAGIIAVGAGGTLVQQYRWRAAATFRNEVLMKARDAAARLNCDRPWFASGPDTLDGVYIFRNGLNEAVAESIPTGTEAASGCRLQWKDGEFR